MTATFVFAENGSFKGIDLKTEKEKPSPKELVETKAIDTGKSKKLKKSNINEDDLIFINDTTTLTDVQKTLGAPQDFMDRNVVETRTTAYVYHLTSGNMLLVAYEHGGVIVKAWVVDSKGNLQKVLIDRTDTYGTVENE